MTKDSRHFDPYVTQKVKRVAINGASLGSNTLVAAVSGKKIRVLSLVLVATGATTVQFKSSTTSDLSGDMALAANVGFSTGYSPVGHFETVAGEALTMALSAAVSVDGFLTYIEA